MQLQFHAAKSLVISLIPLLLSACMLIKPDDSKEGTCRTLKSNIIFNGATSNDREATIQNAEAPLQQHMYEANCTTQ